jgi:NADH dehydrogenase
VTETRPTVVVLGAGFAGLAACDALGSAPVDVVLVDRHTYNTFQPLLYQVATAGLNPGDIAYPVRAFTRGHANVSFRRSTVMSVDFVTRTVCFDEGDSIRYDFIVMATGAATNFFGVPGAAEHAHGIYTMEDAIAVRDEVSRRLEQAAVHGADHGELTVVIVGGGPTGVEMAGTMAELRDVELRTTYREIDPDAARIILLEQRDRLLGAFDARLGDYALAQLEARGVEVRCGTVVGEIAPDRVLLASGEQVPCGVVIWAAGVGPTALTESLDLPKDRGRIQVGPDLRVAGHDDVFAVGDVSVAMGADAVPLPQLAQPAIQEGRHAARQIARIVDGRPTEAFAYRDKGTMATIGRRAAVAELPHGVRLKGTAAWVAWLGLHVVFLLGFRNRAAVLLNWAWRYVSWRRGPRVIAGP